ncbi:Ubiquitin-conjugating enzyme E2 11 [Dichanthelium oligosanthes]|uniref:Ubiquitin-conjugating enzyme E2 11 n=1 Tax=Dichanthelium oligosanthes TaxID=888268 RepID=A0A1E5WHJ7_9POAL|nr:Ubiquitin-conjugating enzyme E2 11 [Dichanthelium oligosanthes]
MGAAPSSPTKTEKDPCKRIRKELHRLWVDPPAFCRPGASPVTDLLHWEAVIDGPEDSPYAGGTFPVDVEFTSDHPVKPPNITFKTKVYHPNINSEGQMVLDIFKENWSPAMTIEKLLLSMVSVLFHPMLDHPVNSTIARLYTTDVELYEKKARAWTRRYASTPVISYYPQKGDENWDDYCDAIAHHNAELEKEERRREAERLRRAAAAASSACHKVRGNGLKLLWKRTVTFLQSRS